MDEILLVHGAFQGGWVWRETASRLLAKGLMAHAPTLSGCGHLRHRLGEGGWLRRWAEEIVAYCQLHVQGKAVLVSHSFAGLPCALAFQLAPAVFRQLIFVDAMLPWKGMSFADLAGPPFLTMLDTHRREGGLIAPWPPGVFGLDAAQWEQFGPRLRHFPEAAFFEPFPDPFEPGETPCGFVACHKTTTPFIRAMAARAKEQGWVVCNLDSGHCPMVANPQDLATLLAVLVRNHDC